MGLLLTALKWELPFIGKRLGSNRLLVKFTKDQQVNLYAYNLNKDRTISWPSQSGEQKTHVRRNWHFLPNGIPVDVIVEGKGENLNVVEANRSTSEDFDTAALCLQYLQTGEMIERRKHKTSKKEMLMLLLCFIGCAAGIIALVNSFTFSSTTLPQALEAIDTQVTKSVAEGVKTGVIDLNISTGGSGVVLPQAVK